jgi:hypothetical protein
MADEWSRTDGVGNEYNYPADEYGKSSSSGVPDANTDPTRTEGWDFGIGRGDGDQATGQGAGDYGLANPGSPGHGSLGVYGPRAELPQDPGGKTKSEDSDSTPTAELAIGGPMHRQAIAWTAEGELPGDEDPPVARSDYYDGPKGGNMMDTVGETKLPGEQMPAKPTPTIPRPAHLGEFMFSDSGLPGDQSVTNEFDKDFGPSTGYRYERTDQPYVKWDNTTHQMRPDPTYQRDPIQGPYVK